MNENCVSIIIPVFNIAEYLERCLNSVRAQTYTNLEIIVVNDGSTDSSGQIACAYRDLDLRVRVIEQKNQGVSVARNCGIHNMTGEYVCFVDGDDFLEPKYIETMVNEIEKEHAQLAVCSIWEEHDDQTIKIAGSQKRKKLARESAMEHIFFDDSFGRSLWNKLFCAEIIKKASLAFYKNYFNGEDMFFLMQYLKFVNIIIKLEEPLYHYVYRSGSAMNQQQWDEKYCLRRTSWICALDDMDKLIPGSFKRCHKKYVRYKTLVQYRILCESVSLQGQQIQCRADLESKLLSYVRKHVFIAVISRDIALYTKIGMLLCCISPKLQVTMRRKRIK